MSDTGEQHWAHCIEYDVQRISGWRPRGSNIDDAPVTIARDRYNRDELRERVNWDLP